MATAKALESVRLRVRRMETGANPLLHVDLLGRCAGSRGAPSEAVYSGSEAASRPHGDTAGQPVTMRRGGAQRHE